MTVTAPTRLPSKTRVQQVGLAIAMIALVACLFVEIPGLEPVGVRMLGIFIAAIALWVTEAIPLAATGVGVIFAQVLLISNDALLPVPADAATSASFFANLANPVIILFMGGFLIADGAAKYGLDKNLAAVLLKPFQGSARMSLLGLMLITALLSQFMSNTATTASMFAVIIPILATWRDPKMRAGFALAIPVSANVTGLGTPVSTPPNAIAVGMLTQNGIRITFLDWVLMALPFMAIMLTISWLVIALLFVPKGQPMELDLKADFNKSPAAVVFYVIAGLTIVLWMTEALHGVSSNIVGFLPVVGLLAMGVMTGRDIKQLSWPVLWLVAGGIALGSGVRLTGLDTWLLGGINWDAMSTTVFLLVVVVVTILMSTFMSNSATANLIIPLVLGPSIMVATDDVTLAVIAAFACSMGFALPISTPPNAIAYATGHIPQRSLIQVGAILGAVGAVVLALLMPPLWAFLGLT
ncbi:MAG: DASS family sodium-coupled anion symporter [Propionibacteriaceae bacterium]|nr:DASS family sodium-coupled anion symporter [Propionibacteriaceae bacterium]